MANIDSKYDSFIHFTIKFNSKDYSISISVRNIQFKKWFNNLFPKNSIQNWFKILNLALFNSTKYSFNEKTRVSYTIIRGRFRVYVPISPIVLGIKNFWAVFFMNTTTWGTTPHHVRPQPPTTRGTPPPPPQGFWFDMAPHWLKWSIFGQYDQKYIFWAKIGHYWARNPNWGVPPSWWAVKVGGAPFVVGSLNHFTQKFCFRVFFRPERGARHASCTIFRPTKCILAGRSL